MPSLFTQGTRHDSLEDKVKVEKLKCLLAYFDINPHQSHNFTVAPPRTICFERKNSMDKNKWSIIQKPLTLVEFSPSCIEDCQTADLHVDFANRKVGKST